MTDTPMTTPPAQGNGTLTSLAQLFSRPINGAQVQAIEIPLFQRDYAQGRKNEQARHVRERFIADLCAALDSDGKSLHLDFVFGDVVNKEDGGKQIPTLYPLDGQQRLTTLFLLHCYLAWHQPDCNASTQPWHAFRYATRPGARAFCQFLTQCRPHLDAQPVSAWLCDQPNYLPTWRHDPTIQGMLVVLDALHRHYQDQPSERLHAAWLRLTDPVNPAIRFLLLPVAAQKLDNTLYVKMNSRGRPLTGFENFKADLEALLHKNPALLESDGAAVKAFSHKIDTDWADLFWPYRGENHLIDEECVRYLRFLFEVRAWKQGLSVQTSLSDLRALSVLSKALLGNQAPAANDNLDWIARALDVWLTVQSAGLTGPQAIGALFATLFTRDTACIASTPLRIFNFRDYGDAPVGVDMFHACCRLYGTRPWSLAHTVLLYGVLHGLMLCTPIADLHRRLRILRNLIEASRSEIRADSTRNNMPALLAEVETIMAGGPLNAVETFNQVQVRNEQAKQALVAAHPTLHDSVCQLEDHELLRGGLTAFDLSPAQNPRTFASRAREFFTLFKHPYHQVSAALLVKGHTGRSRQRSSGHRLAYLGAPRQAGLWENHWRIRYNEAMHPSAAALQALLDDLALGKTPQAVIDTFLQAPSTLKDWRYYIAKYEAMRGASLDFAGNYILGPGPGYAICMPLGDSCDNRSNHHDAYLLALAKEAGLTSLDIRNHGWPRCFPGHETNERHLILRRSGLKIRCVESGWAMSDIPGDPALRGAFDTVASTFAIQNGSFAVLQTQGIDIEDRIIRGAQLLRELIEAGL